MVLVFCLLQCTPGGRLSAAARLLVASHSLPTLVVLPQFLLISDSDIPLYDPLTFYQQVRCARAGRAVAAPRCADPKWSGCGMLLL